MTATLQYGYRTGRLDPDTQIKPTTDPVARNTSVPQEEGLQAEKVIKGLYTGTFNFQVSVIAPANKTALVFKVTCSLATNNATTGPIFGIDGFATKTNGAFTMMKLAVTNPGEADNFLLFQGGALGTTTLWRLNGAGRILMGDSTASFPTLSFLNDTDSGIYRQNGVPARWFFVVDGIGIAEVELVAPNPGDGVRRIRVYGTGNSRTQPNITHGGGIDNNDSGIWWNSEVSGRRKVALVNETGSMVAAYNSNANPNESRRCVAISGVINRAGSGGHLNFNLLELEVMDDGPANAATLTNTTTLYIGGSPDTDTAGKISNFRAIWVRSTDGGGGGVSGGSGGLVEFDGDFIVTGTLPLIRRGINTSMRSIRFGNGLSLAKGGTGTGNHPHILLLELEVIAVTGADTHTNATTLHIVGAPTGTPTGANRALWVRSGSAGGLVEFEGLFVVNSTFTAAAGASATLINFTGTLTEAASGNHARLSLIEFQALGVTAGAATVTDATTVYIAGAPGGVVTGKNRALWVVAGESEFGGIVTIAMDRGLRFTGQTNQAGAGAGTLNNAPAAGDPAFWVPIVVNGTNRAFPVW